MPTCDICALEFPCSKPNPAVADGKVRGYSSWGYACSAHLGALYPHTITLLKEPK